MYTGKNPTAIRSQQWITDAMYSLLERKEYSAINVKDICQKADLSRQTFYQIFDSKEEVLRYCIQQHFSPLLTIPDSKDFQYLATYFSEHIAQNREFIQLINRRNLGHFLTDELSSSLTIITNHFHPERDEKTKKLANAFLTAGLANMLLIWSEDSSISETALVTFLYEILIGKYFQF